MDNNLKNIGKKTEEKVAVNEKRVTLCEDNLCKF